MSVTDILSSCRGSQQDVRLAEITAVYAPFLVCLRKDNRRWLNSSCTIIHTPSYTLY